MAFLIFVTVVLVLVYRGSTPEERTRFGQAVVHVLRRLRQLITLRHQELDSFHDALDARTRVAPVTPILIAANITIFVLIQFTPPAVFVLYNLATDAVASEADTIERESLEILRQITAAAPRS